jgi:hypothetical protein
VRPRVRLVPFTLPKRMVMCSNAVCDACAHVVPCAHAGCEVAAALEVSATTTAPVACSLPMPSTERNSLIHEVRTSLRAVAMEELIARLICQIGKALKSSGWIVEGKPTDKSKTESVWEPGLIWKTALYRLRDRWELPTEAVSSACGIRFTVLEGEVPLPVLWFEQMSTSPIGMFFANEYVCDLCFGLLHLLSPRARTWLIYHGAVV